MANASKNYTFNSKSYRFPLRLMAGDTELMILIFSKILGFKTFNRSKRSFVTAEFPDEYFFLPFLMLFKWQVIWEFLRSTWILNIRNLTHFLTTNNTKYCFNLMDYSARDTLRDILSSIRNYKCTNFKEIQNFKQVSLYDFVYFIISI